MRYFVLKSGIPIIVALAVIALGPGRGRAQDSVSESLESVTVTATRAEQDLMSVPMSVTVITDEQIEERYVGANTAEKLREIPGVSYSPNKTGPGNNSMIMIRGQNPLRVLFLIDGVNQNSVFKEDMNKGLLTIDPSDIERVEVIKGPASSLYGSEAIGGVVNFITKKGGEGKPFGGRLDFTYDHSNRGYRPHVAIYGDTDKYRFRLSGSFQDAGERRAVDMAGKLDHSDFTTQSLFGSVGLTHGSVDADLTFSHYDSDINELTGMYDNAIPAWLYLPFGDPRLTEVGFFPKNRRDTALGTLVLHDPLPYLERLTFKLSYQNRDTIQSSVSYPDWLPQSLLADRSQTFGAYLQADFALGSHELITGVDFVYASMENDAKRSNTDMLFFDARQKNLAIFIQDTWRMTDKLRFIAGARYTMLGTEQGRLDENPDFANKSYNFSNVVWNAGMVYEPFETLSLRAQYSQGFRAPDLATKYTGTGGYIIPNPEVRPETSESYELGVRYNNENLFIDAAVFYSNIEDFIKAKFLGWYQNHYVWRGVNTAEYRTIGFELDMSYKLWETGLTAYGNYTYMDGKLEDTETGATQKNISSPRQWGSIGLKWERDVSDSLRIFADALFRSSAKYIYDSDGVIMYRNRSGNTMDFNLGFDFGEERRLKVVLALRNLFDQPYEPSYYYYPARHFVLTASCIY